uniref:Uncharacterized protein n=1 Tax=candidate division WOR-3 bacterium TaxID=2052148 RepID=A0A7C4YH55_UNCW3
MRFVMSLLIVCAFIFPVVLNAQFTDACAQANIDAQTEVNKTMWLAIGFLLGFPIGWPLLPMVIEPSPPATKLLGMPPDYVTTYTSCFKEAGKKVENDAALKGCVAGMIIYVGCWLIYYLIIASAIAATPY